MQKLVDFIPTAFILNYLKSINRLRDEKRVVGQECLMQGYQYVLKQKLKSPNAGAYKNWDSGLPDIETTAIVAKFLGVAKQWIEIQDSNIIDALNYLKIKQQRSGSFLAVDGTENMELTATVAIAFLENHPSYVERFKRTIELALSFLSSQFVHVQEDYFALAISAYALALGKNSAAKTFLDKLDDSAIVEKNLKFWDSGDPSRNVATAAYVILAYETSAHNFKNLEIVKWLVTQRNEHGGFHTSMDTIIGIQAVSKMAEYFHTDRNEMDLYFLYDDAQKEHISMTSDSSYKMDDTTIDLPSIDHVSVQTNGTGIAYVQVWQTYFSRLPESSEKFKIDIKRVQSNQAVDFTVEFCVNYKHQGKSKMTVAELALPSGYIFDDGKFSNTAVMARIQLFFHINFFQIYLLLTAELKHQTWKIGCQLILP